MTSRRVTALGFALFLIGTIVWASSGNPPNAHTAAPGEAVCSDCHGNLNLGGGSVTISGPPQYTPGQTYTITVGVSRTGQQRWGFQATALTPAHVRAGTLVATNTTRTRVETELGPNRQYVEHTSAGTDLGVPNAAPGWTFDWVAPSSGVGPVTFYVAGNAANGNGNTLGDFIYTTALVIPQTPDVACCIPGSKLRGDASTAGGSLPAGDGITDGSDLGVYVDYIFFNDASSIRLDCLEAIDVKNDGVFDGGDLGVMVDYIFFGDTSVITRCDGSSF